MSSTRPFSKRYCKKFTTQASTVEASLILRPDLILRAHFLSQAFYSIALRTNTVCLKSEDSCTKANTGQEYPLLSWECQDKKKEKPSYKIKLIGFQLLFHVRSLHVISHDYWTLLFQLNKDAQFPCQAQLCSCSSYINSYFPKHIKLGSCLLKLQQDLGLDIDNFFKQHSNPSPSTKKS